MPSQRSYTFLCQMLYRLCEHFCLWSFKNSIPKRALKIVFCHIQSRIFNSVHIQEHLLWSECGYLSLSHWSLRQKNSFHVLKILAKDTFRACIGFLFLLFSAVIFTCYIRAVPTDHFKIILSSLLQRILKGLVCMQNTL